MPIEDAIKPKRKCLPLLQINREEVTKVEITSLKETEGSNSTDNGRAAMVYRPVKKVMTGSSSAVIEIEGMEKGDQADNETNQAGGIKRIGWFVGKEQSKRQISNPIAEQEEEVRGLPTKLPREEGQSVGMADEMEAPKEGDNHTHRRARKGVIQAMMDTKTERKTLIEEDRYIAKQLPKKEEDMMIEGQKEEVKQAEQIKTAREQEKGSEKIHEVSDMIVEVVENKGKEQGDVGMDGEEEYYDEEDGRVQLDGKARKGTGEDTRRHCSRLKEKEDKKLMEVAIGRKEAQNNFINKKGNDVEKSVPKTPDLGDLMDDLSSGEQRDYY
ncbi:hypothetical protein E2562_016486 [Oryza meyeriana var. granulata]|uniref:Uncharacterized protein n=1 Tax=Oryza meyeriana var. granulata TaxID=110450 RepID=A0A6G1BL85_9ORYZ|nr:hypothetical protein E2562_016486 [Oryza meyeriana var. granulata]